MKPNILFLLIDSLRSDKTYGFKKKSRENVLLVVGDLGQNKTKTQTVIFR